MLINVPISIPDGSVFRIRKPDGTYHSPGYRWGKFGKVYSRISFARNAIANHRINGAVIEVLSVTKHSEHPHGQWYA